MWNSCEVFGLKRKVTCDLEKKGYFWILLRILFTLRSGYLDFFTKGIERKGGVLIDFFSFFSYHKLR